MLLRQTIAYLPAQTIGPVLQLLSVLVWTHFMSPAELGAYALLTAWVELAHTGFVMWFGLYCLRYFDRGTDLQAFLNSESAVLLAATLAAILASLALPLWLEADWSPLLLGSCVALTVMRVIAIYLGDRARAQQDVWSYTLLQGVWPIAGLFLGLLLINSMAAPLTAVVLGYAIAQAIALIPAMARLGIGTKPFNASKEILTAALRYGLPLMLSGILIWIATNGARLVIAEIDGPTGVGLVTVGLTIGIRIAGFAAMLVTAAAFPLAVRRARDEGIDAGQDQLVRNGALLLAVLVPAAAGVLAISTPFVKLFVAPPFQAASLIVLPLAIAASVARNIRIHFFDQIFLLREQPALPMVTSCIDAVATVAFVIAGYYISGLTGAIAGAAVAALAALGFSSAMGLAQHRYALPLFDLSRILAAAGAMWLVIARAMPVPATPLQLGLTIAAGAMIYPLVLAALFPRQAADTARELAGWLRQPSPRGDREQAGQTERETHEA